MRGRGAPAEAAPASDSPPNSMALSLGLLRISAKENLLHRSAVQLNGSLPGFSQNFHQREPITQKCCPTQWLSPWVFSEFH